MPDRPAPRPDKSVFDQLESALDATEHGRAFLQEYGRRSRSKEAAQLLGAVARLERRFRAHVDDLDREDVSSLVGQIETALRDAKLAFGRSLTPPHERLSPDEAPDLAGYGRQTSQAVLGCAEVIQETAWRLRESGVDPALCDCLDEQTTAIYDTCRRQQRTLEGLGTVERALGRAEAFLGELRRAVAPDPRSGCVPLTTTLPATLIDGDIEFVVAQDEAKTGKDR